MSNESVIFDKTRKLNSLVACCETDPFVQCCTVSQRLQIRPWPGGPLHVAQLSVKAALASLRCNIAKSGSVHAETFCAQISAKFSETRIFVSEAWGKKTIVQCFPPIPVHRLGPVPCCVAERASNHFLKRLSNFIQRQTVQHLGLHSAKLTCPGMEV